jgi:hypothetical protein
MTQDTLMQAPTMEGRIRSGRDRANASARRAWVPGSGSGQDQDTLVQAPIMGAGSGPGMTEDKPTLARAWEP